MIWAAVGPEVTGWADAITPDGTTVYVVIRAPGESGTVTPIRTPPAPPGEPVKVGTFPVAIVLTPG